MSASPSIAHLELGHDEHDAEENLDLRWRRFLNENPEAIAALVEIAREIKAAGHDRVSMKLVFEVARFRFLIRQAPGEKFALNNSYTSRDTSPRRTRNWHHCSSSANSTHGSGRNDRR